MPESTHAQCVHENTKAARALCRREHVVSNTDMVVTHAMVFVRQARAEGHVNKLEEITLWEVAQEHGIEKWDDRLAIKLVLDRAYMMDELGMIGETLLSKKRSRQARRL